jgi:hypothetical protein
MFNRALWISLVLVTLLTPIAQPLALSVELASDPVTFTREYLLGHMEALIQERPELIDAYFDLSNPTSRGTHMFETLRSRYVAKHLTQAVQGLMWYSDEIEVELLSRSVDTARLRATYSGVVQTNHMDVPTLFNDDTHVIVLRKGKLGTWYVETDDYEDIFVRSHGRVKPNEFDALFEEQELYWSEGRQRDAKYEQELRSARSAEMDEATSGARSYNLLMLDRAKVRWYALQYTENYSDDRYRPDSYNNDVFRYATYNGANADCQNFVSQVLWYGFGGTNSHPVSTGYPMIKDQPGHTPWWCDKTSYSTAWVNVPGFCLMIEANHADTSKYGVCGYRTHNNSPAALLIGDVVIDIKQGEWGTAGHALIITNILDHAPYGSQGIEDIYVSAHNANHKDRLLALVYTSQDKLRYAYITFLRKP